MTKTNAPKFIFGKGGAGRVVPVECKINVPMEDGTMQKQIITARCEIIDQDAVDAFWGPNGGGETALLRQVIQGFDGLEADGGGAADDTTAKEALLKLPYVRIGLLSSYMAMLGGHSEKN